MNGSKQSVFNNSKWIKKIDRDDSNHGFKEERKKKSIPNNGTGKAQKSIR